MSADTQLKLLKDFQCIADKCPDDCCHGFTVNVDVETELNWKALPDSDIKQRVFSSLTGEGKTTSLQKNSQGICQLLDSGLCAIQKSVGHDYLPKICRDFPRLTTGRDERPVFTAYMSCPEIARLLVENKESASELFTSLIDTEIDAKTLSADPLQAEKLLQLYIYKLLAHVETSVGEIVYLTGTMLQRMISRATIRQALQDLETVCFSDEALQKSIDNIRKQFRNRRLILKKNRAGELWHFSAMNCRALQHSDYADLWEPFNQSETDPSIFYSEVSKLKTGSRSLDQAVQHTLKKYLEVKFVNHGFPYACHETRLVATFLDCLVGLSQILLLLWLLGQKGKISQQDLVNVIYRVERGLVHNDLVSNRLLQYAERLDEDGYILSFLYLS